MNLSSSEGAFLFLIYRFAHGVLREPINRRLKLLLGANDAQLARVQFAAQVPTTLMV